MTDKQPMQADGSGTERGKADQDGEIPAAQHGAGESQGGAYPNPHGDGSDGHFDGGQSERAYHGSGQLGEQKTGEQPNAGSRE